MRELKSPVVIDEGGKRKVITKEVAIAKQLVNGAARGNHQARRTVIDLRAQELERSAEKQQPEYVDLNELTDEQLAFLATPGGTIEPRDGLGGLRGRKLTFAIRKVFE